MLPARGDAIEYARVISLPSTIFTTEMNCPGVKTNSPTSKASNSKWRTSGASSRVLTNLALSVMCSQLKDDAGVPLLDSHVGGHLMEEVDVHASSRAAVLVVLSDAVQEDERFQNVGIANR